MNELSGKPPSDRELAALADGTLSAERRREIENQIAGSEQIRDSINKQRDAVDLMRELDVPAPDALRATVAGLAAERAPRRRKPLAIGGAIGVAAAALIALALVLGSGSDGSKITVERVVAAASGGPSMPAPAKDPDHPGKLALGVDGVQFPTWDWPHGGWKVTGARSEAVDGRPINTVFYENGKGATVKYSIVSGAPVDDLANPDGYLLTSNGDTRRIVWRNGGRTCIIEARGVEAGQLEKLIA